MQACWILMSRFEIIWKLTLPVLGNMAKDLALGSALSYYGKEKNEED